MSVPSDRASSPAAEKGNGFAAGKNDSRAAGTQPAPIGVLLVCLGNICRSPTAHSVLQQRIDARNLQDSIRVDSAGTGDWHVGKPPDHRTTRAARARGYRLEDLVARQVREADFFDFDYLLAMDRDNLADLEARRPADADCQIQLFLDYSQRPEVEVPDPYNSGSEGFELVLDMVEEAADRLLAALVERHFRA